MQPNAPAPAPPPIVPSGSTPTGYEFLNAPQKTPRKLLPVGNSKKSRIIIFAGGLGILVIIAIMLIGLLGSSGKTTSKELLLAAQQQQELIRISTIGTQKARDSSALNRAVTVQLTLQSDQAKLLAIAKAQGKTITPKELALGKNAKTDVLLTQAEQANHFDDTFNSELLQELATYQATLKKIYDATTKKAAKETLAQQFNHVTLLAPAKK